MVAFSFRLLSVPGYHQRAESGSLPGWSGFDGDYSGKVSRRDTDRLAGVGFDQQTGFYHREGCAEEQISSSSKEELGLLVERGRVWEGRSRGERPGALELTARGHHQL